MIRKKGERERETQRTRLKKIGKYVDVGYSEKEGKDHEKYTSIDAGYV